MELQTDGSSQTLGGETIGSAGHSEYYTEKSESFWNLTAVATGHAQDVTQGPVFNAEQAAPYRLYPGQ